LEWESYEQTCLWTFINSEFGYYLDNNKFILQLFIDEKIKFTKGIIYIILLYLLYLLFIYIYIFNEIYINLIVLSFYY